MSYVIHITEANLKILHLFKFIKVFRLYAASGKGTDIFTYIRWKSFIY